MIFWCKVQPQMRPRCYATFFQPRINRAISQSWRFILIAGGHNYYHGLRMFRASFWLTASGSAARFVLSCGIVSLPIPRRAGRFSTTLDGQVTTAVWRGAAIPLGARTRTRGKAAALLRYCHPQALMRLENVKGRI